MSFTLSKIIAILFEAFAFSHNYLKTRQLFPGELSVKLRLMKAVTSTAITSKTFFNFMLYVMCFFFFVNNNYYWLPNTMTIGDENAIRIK